MAYCSALDPAHGLPTGLPHAAWGSPSCPGYLNAITVPDEAQIICSECGGLAFVGPATSLEATLTRMRHTRLTTILHQSFGAPDCCGCLNAVTRADEADIVCGECGAIIRTVPAADVERVLSEMELSLDVLSQQCPIAGL